jgi:Acyl-CoA dehydrogenase, C-terminal domain
MIESVDDPFLATSSQAMQTSGGAAALDALGWWELLADLDDADARTAVFSAFRAQGRALANSAALAALVAQPHLEHTAIAPGTVLAAIQRPSARRGPTWLLVGDHGGRHLLFDDPPRGTYLVEPDDVELRPVDIPGRLSLNEVRVDLEQHRPLPNPSSADARTRSVALGRIAAAAEILGSAERAVSLAVQHAIDREQFGRPIAQFQAVRHLLAWAKTDCVAIAATVRTAVDLVNTPPARFDQVVKALAGRNGRRACERSLQVMGAIGFTAEHQHHHHHSRVLALDSILGTSTELTRDLGTWLRTSATDPGYPATLMAHTA